MISKLAFINNKSKTKEITASYSRVYGLDLGKQTTVSDIGILYQEARSVKFSLVADDFLFSLITVANKYLDYKINVYDLNNKKIYSGLIKDSGVSYNQKENMIEIELVDITAFLQNAGTVDASSIRAVDMKKIVFLSLISGLKNRLPIYDGDGFGVEDIHIDRFKIAVYSDAFFIEQGYLIENNEFSALKVNYQNGVASLPVDWSHGFTQQRVELRKGENTIFYMDEPKAYNGGYNVFRLFTNDTEIEMGDEYVYEETCYLLWIDKERQISKEGLKFEGKPVPVEELYKYNAYYAHLIKWTATDWNKLFGYSLNDNMVFKSIGSVQTILSYESRHDWFLDYKHPSKGPYRERCYWVTVTEKPLGYKRVINRSQEATGSFVADTTTGYNEWCVTNTSRLRNLQYALFFRFDYNPTDDKVTINIYHVLMGYGYVFHDNSNAPPSDPQTNYSVRVRTLIFSGYQLESDSWDFGFLSAPLFQVANCYAEGGVVYETEFYPLTEHFGKVRELDGFDRIYNASDLVVEKRYKDVAKNLAKDLSECQHMLWCHYEDRENLSLPEILEGKTFWESLGFDVDSPNVLKIDNQVVSHTLTDRYGSPMTYVIITHGDNVDLTLSGMNPPSEPHYRNCTRYAVLYSGKVNLKSYHLKPSVNLYEVTKLGMVSNYLSMFVDENNNEIKIVDKIPIGESTTFSQEDMIDFKLKAVVQNSFDDSIFSPLPLDNVKPLELAIKEYIHGLQKVSNYEITFTYSGLFSGKEPKIGDNFDYNGARYSIVSIEQKTPKTYDIVAIVNGASFLDFNMINNESDKDNLQTAELFNADLEILENWEIRTL